MRAGEYMRANDQLRNQPEGTQMLAFTVTIRLTATDSDELLTRLSGYRLGDDEWVMTITELPEIIQVPPDLQAPPARAGDATQLPARNAK